MPEPLLRVWHSRGVALTQGYGLTEAAPNVLCLPDEEARTRIGSAGKPYPHVVAWVVVRSGASSDETEVLDFARSSLAKFKVPRRVIFIDHIPRSSSDKVRRRVLLEQWTAESAQAGRISS